MGALTDFSPTDFQKKCVAGLTNLVLTKGGELVGTETSGVRETCIEVKFILLDTSHAAAWIYEDECMLVARGDSYHFEKPDFESPEEMQESFLELVSSVLRGEYPRSKSSHWIGLFRGREL
jgi:hypothetical protein